MPDVLVALTTWIGVTSLRWLTLDFDNDYFMHVSWAAEMLRGQLPVRHFVEPGFPLQTLISYASMKTFGLQMGVEGIVACAFLGAASTCVYSVCRTLGVSRTLSVIAALISALAYPRLYAYPKAFVYPAALLAIAAYIKAPRASNLRLLSIATALAFLFRHDHGVWIAAVVLFTLVMVHRDDWRPASRAVITFSILTVGLTSPWVLWVLTSGHAAQYVRTLADQGSGAMFDWRLPDRAFTVDTNAPLVVLDPVTYPEVGIRWQADTTDAVRQDRENRYGLARSAASTDGYHLTDLRQENVLALLQDPVVHDTRGIDRQTARVPSGGFAWMAERTYQALPLLRLRVLPGLLKSDNALPWLTYATFALPWILLAYIGWRTLRDPRREMRPDVLIGTAAAVMAIIGYQRLVRGSPDSRIADIAPLTAVIAAYLTACVWHGFERWWWISRPALLVLAFITAASAMAYGHVGARLEAAGVDGPTNLVRRARDVYQSYRGEPFEVFAPPGARGLAALARWLHECTRPDQRVAVLGFEPQVNVWSARGFAGGLAYFDLGWMSDPRDQRLAIERWRDQDVPFALLMGSEAEAFPRNYALVNEWLQDRYVAVASSAFGGSKPVTVYMERTRTAAGLHGATALPCLIDPIATPSLIAETSSGAVRSE